VLAYIYCISMFFSPGSDFDSLCTSKKIGWEEHLRYDLFSGEWDIKQTTASRYLISIKCEWLSTSILDKHFKVVLEVATDTWQVVN